MSASPKATKTRSPNYPALNLEEAIQKLKVIYEQQQRYPATRETYAKLMGYSGLNGASATVLSALSKYGLLEGHGDQLRVSEIGQDLILHRKGDAEYTEAVRSAAFMPAFFRELRDDYPTGLPSDHHLRASLIKRGFNPKAIDNAVRAYRDTIEFVDDETEDAIAESPRSSTSEVAMQTQPFGSAPNRSTFPTGPNDPQQRAVSLPLSVTEWATLQAPFPLTELAWDQMIAVLQAMKPALVVAPEQQPSTATQEQSEPDEE